MTKKNMFKRILKVVGFVILGVALVVGGMIGVMAIRGDFKDKKIEPTEISFQIDNVKLNYNINMASEEDNIYSFTIKALPEDVTELECTLKVSEPIITFKKKEGEKWVDYNSNIFYLNRPIYFALKNITDENINFYNDGIITIDVEAGFLKSSINIEIDRTVTSISFEDKGNAENNKITNGLFSYEYDINEEGIPVPKYNGANEQKLELVMNQDYPLEIITAPLKALKPFNSVDAKMNMIYLVESNQLKLLTHQGEDVKLQVFNDLGEIHFEDCSFIRFDVEKGVYIFNSANTGNYEFKLAVYKTYADQERIEQSLEMSVDEKLAEMLTKTVVITVTGTDAQYIKLGEVNNISLDLLENNRFVLNDPTAEGVTNLGLAITKNGGVEIVGRYNELSFVDENSFSNSLIWNFNMMTEKEDGGFTKVSDKIATIKFDSDSSGKKFAKTFGLSGVPDGTNFSVELKYDEAGLNYNLTLIATDLDDSGEVKYKLSILLAKDDISGKVLSPVVNESGVIEIKDTKTNTVFSYLQFIGGNTMILGDAVDEIYNFKTLKQGLYLVFVGKTNSETLFRNINNRFKFEITKKNGADNEVNIIPIDSSLKNLSKYLYAIIVNADGTLAYTNGGEYSSSACTVNVASTTTEVELEQEKVFMPITVKNEGFDYNKEIPVQSLVKAKSGSYKDVGILLFAPKYELLTKQPDNWENNFGSYYKYEAGTGYTKLTEKTDWTSSVYYTKNNYSFIDGISYLNGGVRYYLLGYVGNDGKFVNSVKATGENSGSKLYPLVPQTNYLINYNRNQTAEEFVDYILANAGFSGEVSAKINEGSVNINYNTSLSIGKKVYIIDGYKQASSDYDKNETYYIDDGNGNYVSTKPSKDEINNWETSYERFYIVALRYVNVNQYVMGVTYYKVGSDEDYVECTEEAKSHSADWETVKTTYFVKENGYIIKNVQNDGFNPIKITAVLCSDGIEIAGNQIVVQIEQATHESVAIVLTSPQNNFESDARNNTIQFQSYYDFNSSTIKPNAQFSGNYYEIPENISESKYYIIAGHKNINNMNWAGESTTEGAIASYKANIVLGIGSKNAKEILGNISKALELKAYEYNVSNQLVKTNCEAISFGVKEQQEGYTKASNQFDNTIEYFKKGENGVYNVEDITAEIQTNWATEYVNYYVKTVVINVEFYAIDTLENGNYVRLAWIYSGSGSEYVVQSDRLYIQSRQVKGYKLDVGTTPYKATRLTASSYDGEFYEINENNEYVLVPESERSKYEPNKFYVLKDYVYVLETAENVENWEVKYRDYYVYDDVNRVYKQLEQDTVYKKDTYYTKKLDYIPYTSEIAYKIIVGWDAENSKYSYMVYAIDDEYGDNLFSVAEGGIPTAISTDIDKAFNFGGWIKLEPFYATNIEYNIISEKLEDNYNRETSTHNLSVKSLTNNRYVDVVLQNTASSNVGLTIKAVIVQENFTFTSFEDVSSADKEILIQNGRFKYLDANLDDKLNVDVSKIDITRNNVNITANYQYSKQENGSVRYVNKDDEEDYIEIAYDGQWKVKRSQFINVEMTLLFSCVMGSTQCNISFINPYSVVKSTTNNTDCVYSGTTFTLAKIAQKSEDITEDVLYKLITPNSNGAGFKINVYKLNSSDMFVENVFYAKENVKFVQLTSKPYDWETNYSKYYEKVTELTAVESLLNYVVPEVIKETEVVFEIYYIYGENSEFVDTFALKVMPNAVITTDLTKTVQIDDYNTVYNVADLKIKKFNIATYFKYELKDENLTDITTEVALQFETFTDNQFINKYSTNVVKFDSDNGIVKADIIGEKGTYYVKASVLIDEAIIGEIKFEVTSKSDIVGEKGQIEDLTITAKTLATYTLTDLNEIYKLQRSGELYIPTNEYVAGKTYKYDSGKYVLLEDEEIDVQYYVQAELKDIFFIDYNNPNLEVEYNYGGVVLKQKILVEYIQYNGEFNSGETYYYISNGKYLVADKKISGIDYYTKLQTMMIVYGGKQYKLVGTTFNFAGEKYDLKTNTILEKSVEEIDNNVIRTNTGKSLLEEAYYCKQNALIFKGLDELLILSFDGNKKVYLIDSNNITSTNFAKLNSLTLNYNQFGEIEENGGIKDYSIGYVSEIEYSIIPVFAIDNVNYCISTKDKNLIKVKPYIKSASMNTLIANTEYSLYGAGNLFEADANIRNFAFGTGTDDFAIINGSILRANENGNKYVIKLPITLTYVNGLTYLYNYEFEIVSAKVVGINYPFGVTDKESANFTLFNTKLDNLTNGMDTLAYDLTDLGEWLGYNTDSQDFENATMKFDLLLRGDKINLAVNNAIGDNRFVTYARVGKNAVYDDSTTYYIYDNTIQNYRIAQHGVDVDVDKFKNYINYFTKTADEIGDIEIVAVSSTLADTLQNVKDNVICRNGIITVGDDFNYTGYVAFKVYIKNSSAYGYYVAKIVDDDNFNNTIDSVNSRYTQTISPTMTGNKSIIDIIRTSGTDISSVGRFDNSLLAGDSSNIYLFMIDNYDNVGNPVKFDNGNGNFDVSIKNGQLIDNALRLKPDVNAQTVKVAVVINCNVSSLVYVCNYTISILSNVTVATTSNIESVIDKAHNIYKAKSISFDYVTGNNTKPLADFLSVEDTSGSVALNSIEFDTDKTENKNITVEGNSIYYILGENKLKFAQINGTDLMLTSGVSQTMEFCLKLIYNNDFVAYLQIVITAYEPKDANNDIELGKYDGSKFVNSINISDILGSYSGEYTLHYSTDRVNFVEYVAGNGIIEKTGEVLTITSTTKEIVVYVKFTLKDLVPEVTTSYYTLKCSPTISTVWAGVEGNTSRLKISNETTLSAMGSKLLCEINTNSGITTLTIKNGGSVVLTIYVKDFALATFTLTESGKDANKYFSNYDKISLAENGDIGFVHLPKDMDFTLLITVNTSTGSYTGVGMILTLPKTYEVETNYRTSLYEELGIKPEDWEVNYSNYYLKDGERYVKNTSSTYDISKIYYKRTNANIETVVENSEIELYNCDENAISTQFFGGTDTGDIVNVNARRVHFVFNGLEVDSLNAINYIGILNNANPNYLKTASVQGRLEAGGASVKNGNTLLVGNAGETATLTMSNELGVSFEYQFQVYTQEADLSKFEFEDLLYVEDENYISVSINQLCDNKNNVNEAFILGYLNYYASNENGNLGWVKTSNEEKISFKITQGTGARLGCVSLKSINKEYFNIENTQIKITIITLNGISKQFTLNITNVNTVYGYEGTYETLYAGTEGYRLTDNTSTGRVRIDCYDTLFKEVDSVGSWETSYNNYYTYNSSTRKYVKNNFAQAPDFNSDTWYRVSGTSVFDNTYFTITYQGAVNGLVTYLPYNYSMDYGKNDTSVVWYDTTNKTFGTRAVKSSMDLTLVFNVEYDGIIITRLYYSISVKNDIRIGINRMLDENQTLDLYLGSSIYTKNGNKTTINLLQSESGNEFNNIFVTLERFSTNNVIYDTENKYVGKALYNGNANDKLKTYSTYSFGNVSQYLQFSVSNISSGLEGKIEINQKGELTILGNPEGSFALNVFSTNGTGYGKSFDIKVNPYYKVVARFNDSLNVGNWKSGGSVSLLASGSNMSSDSAFNIYQVGYGIKDDESVEITSSVNVNDIKIQTKVFDIGTPFADIKKADWGTNSTNITLTNGRYDYTLPEVPYSKSTTDREYYIVTVRLIVTHHGQETSYFANYRVYNTAYIEVNEKYKNKKVVIYNETSGCWTTGNTVVLMDISNKGMYSLLTPLSAEPSDWKGGNYYQHKYVEITDYEAGFEANKYYLKNDDNVYTLLSSEQAFNQAKNELKIIYQITNEFESLLSEEHINIRDNYRFVVGQYYKINDVVSALANGSISLWIENSSGVETKLTVIANEGTNNNIIVKAVLPDKLFTNSAEIVFKFKDTNGTVLLEDVWTFKSNEEISAKSTKLLTDFFLQSEISNQAYYNTEIIGIMSDSNNNKAKEFVNNATGAVIQDSPELTINGLKLHKVVYTASGNTVFTTTYEAYIIVGASSLMQINFNGGNYYINYVVDDNSGSEVNIKNYISIWSMNNGEFTSSTVTPAVSKTSGNAEVGISGSKVTLINVEKYTSGQSVGISISANGVTRKVDLYFNIVISAKQLNGSNQMLNNSKLNEVIGENTALTEDDIENNIELKKTLLQLIKFNGLSITENDISKFKIRVEKGEEYSIIYSYTDTSASYTRTLKMALS